MTAVRRVDVAINECSARVTQQERGEFVPAYGVSLQGPRLRPVPVEAVNTSGRTRVVAVVVIATELSSNLSA